MPFQLGDAVKRFLAPFVKGTRFEHCAGCERRRKWLNRVSGKCSDWLAVLLCPCTYKNLLSTILGP